MATVSAILSTVTSASFITGASAVAGTVAAGTGLVLQQQGAKRARSAQRSQAAATRRAEAARRRQMQLQARRERRQAFRQQQAAQAQGLQAFASSGAGVNSSGIQGGFAETSSTGAEQIVSVRQNLELGEQIFSANEQSTAAQFGVNRARAQQSTGQGLFNLGTNVVRNSTDIGQIGQSLFTQST